MFRCQSRLVRLLIGLRSPVVETVVLLLMLMVSFIAGVEIVLVSLAKVGLLMFP